MRYERRSYEIAVEAGTHLLAKEELYDYKKERLFTKWHLFIGSMLSSDSELNNLIAHLHKATPRDKIHLIINSPGGYTAHQFVIANTINNIFKFKNITAEIRGRAASAAACLFLIGKRRIMCAGSEIMFHTHTLYLEGKSHEIKKYVEYKNDHLGSIMRKMLSPYFTKEEIEDIIEGGKDHWITWKEAYERGIATEIKDFPKGWQGDRK